MLPPGDLELNRGILDESLPDRCVISGYTAGSADSMGGWTGGTAITGGTVACRVSPTQLQPDELQFAGQLGEVQVYLITLPAETTIQPADQITSSGVTYEVIAPRGPRTWEISRRVVAVKVG